MASYQQMGDKSENLLYEEHLNSFRGAILSPVNYPLVEVQRQIVLARDRDTFEMIFDPQLYVPTSERGFLREWEYFPSDFDTADLGSITWWQGIAGSIARTCIALGATAVCTPAFMPGAYTNEYYSMMTNLSTSMAEELRGTSVGLIQTAIVSLGDVRTPGRSMTIASILSGTVAKKIYLLFVADSTVPRREIGDPEGLKGVMRLISALEESGLSVLVGYCSSEMVLWKAAGASSCATGKFFNLRRFTRSRFEQPAEGGGQLPYWFEEALLAFLRESDLQRVRQRNLLSQSSLNNPYGIEILNQLDTTPGLAWVALGWRQYMYWFAEMERRIATGNTDIAQILLQSEYNWLAIEETTPPLLMEEPRNDGSWVRAWRRALVEFPSH